MKPRRKLQQEVGDCVPASQRRRRPGLDQPAVDRLVWHQPPYHEINTTSTTLGYKIYESDSDMMFWGQVVTTDTSKKCYYARTHHQTMVNFSTGGLLYHVVPT